MSSALERFRNRQLNTALISVPWPTAENPQFIFAVSKFAHEEHVGAEDEAMGLLRKRGFTKPGPDASDDDFAEYNAEYSSALAIRLCAVVKRHIKKWEFKGDGEFDYSIGRLEGLFLDMDRLERIQLGSSYYAARLDAEAKKSEPATPATPAS